MEKFSGFNEKTRHFVERTNSHISKVQLWANIIQDNFPEYYNLRLETMGHDSSKFESPEVLPYIEINWYYKCKKEGIEYEYDEEYCNKASYHHITNNKHHPEYWDPEIKIECLNSGARDKPGKYIVDATRMPLIQIVAMCCDWCAMSSEVGGSPIKWANKMIGTRWNFNNEQIKIIYEVLNKVWK
jgi:hypothetical protein